MKLPKKGCLVDPTTGGILWAWEHNDPDFDFDVLPPIITNLQTGEVRSVSNPDSVVLDLEAVVKVGDVPMLYKDMSTVRCRKDQAGEWHFKKLVSVDGVQVEVDHDLETVIKNRKAK